MPNMTMTIDADILKKAKKIAIEKNTTISKLVRTYLENLAARKDQAMEMIIGELKDSFSDKSVCVGSKKWSREDLHERE
ncbi:hypothetical protein MNBD_BACTEROID05-1243 [hydrothermal vent metagenome]|uniref:Ribbon-helix-helix protein CopG domain-containing protein n=1 Tax=hydrothermal vent metagenome TaxID=652676 RepID=A0A3B0T4L4_9ZZZZ